MPLTPSDVSNKLFTRKYRGYDMEEVDGFLDEVESELTRLLRENGELRTKSGATGPAAAPTPALTTAAPTPPEPANVPVVAPQPAPPVPARPAPLAPGEGQEAALRTLLMAQRTADEVVAEARAEAEQALHAARTEAEQTLTSARTESETSLTKARREADQTLSSARSESDRLLTEARNRRAQAEAEVSSRVELALGDLESRRRTLEAHIEDLRAFEREYRTRLKAYLQGQLRDLDNRDAPEDTGAGVPAGGPALSAPAAASQPAPAALAAPASAPASAPVRSPFAELHEGGGSSPAERSDTVGPFSSHPATGPASMAGPPREAGQGEDAHRPEEPSNG
ncbi:MAG: ag [Frankiales bacterium]|nr:ag [Frankiales bacterium]